MASPEAYHGSPMCLSPRSKAAAAPPPASTLACLNLGAPANALSVSPDRRFAIVGGRDVLKIVAVDTLENQLTEHRNLRVGRVNLNFSTNDVRWHPLEACKNLVASAASNGAVVIWNLDRAGASKQERVLPDHTRTVNRVVWHPTEPDLLISASHDGSIKVWDARGQQRTTTLRGKAESVRDVGVNPFNPNIIAAAFDNGCLQLWDLRKEAMLQQITAHHGLVLSLAWHPEVPDLIASGSRDRLVKVWDLRETRQSPRCVQTIASVGRLLWRPGYPSHLLSSASLVDNKIHLWDVTRGYIPVASVAGHRDVATGAAFVGGAERPELLLSASKDGTLQLHDLRRAHLPFRHLRATSCAFSPRGELLAAAGPVDRARGPDSPSYPPVHRGPEEEAGSATSHAGGAAPPASAPCTPREAPAGPSPRPRPSTPAPHFFSSAPASRFARPSSAVSLSYMPSGSPPPGAPCHSPGPPHGLIVSYRPAFSAVAEEDAGDFDEVVFRHLAEHYRLSGPSPADVCAHNARVATEAARPRMAAAWSVLRLFLERPGEASPRPAPAPAAPASDPASASASAKPPTPSVSSVDEGSAPGAAVAPAPAPPGAPRARSPGRPGQSRSPALRPIASPHLASISFAPPPPPPRCAPAAAALDAHATSPPPLRPSGAPPWLGDEDELLSAPVPLTYRETVTPSPSGTPSEESDGGYDSLEEGSSDDGRGPGGSAGGYGDGPEGSSEASACYGELLGVPPGELVGSLLEYYSEVGDVQACATLALVAAGAGHVFGEWAPEPLRLRRFLVAYVQLLQRLEAWKAAHEVVRHYGAALAAAAGPRAGGVPVSEDEMPCAECGAAMPPGAARCGGCGRALQLCSTCNEPVRGLYVWCQGCQHGGHLHHLQEWFARSGLCPAGCGHECGLAPSLTSLVFHQTDLLFR
eukprot:tig00000093_g3669.t1